MKKTHKYEGWSFKYEYVSKDLPTFPYTRVRKMWNLYYHGIYIATASRRQDIVPTIRESEVGGYLNLMPVEKNPRFSPEL